MPFRRTALSYSHPTSPRSLFSLSLQPAVFPAISSPCLDPSQPPDARIDREKEDFAGNKFFGDSLSFRLVEPTTTTPEEYFTPVRERGVRERRRSRECGSVLDENISGRRTKSEAAPASCCSGSKNKDGQGIMRRQNDRKYRALACERTTERSKHI